MLWFFKVSHSLSVLFQVDLLQRGETCPAATTLLMRAPSRLATPLEQEQSDDEPALPAQAAHTAQVASRSAAPFGPVPV